MTASYDHPWFDGPDHRIQVRDLDVRWSADRRKVYTPAGTIPGKKRLHYTVWWKGILIFERQPGLLLPRFPTLPWLNRLIHTAYYALEGRVKCKSNS